MLFKLFIPYQGSLSESNEVNDYYASAEEYVAALQQEESTNGSVIFILGKKEGRISYLCMITY